MSTVSTIPRSTIVLCLVWISKSLIDPANVANGSVTYDAVDEVAIVIVAANSATFYFLS